VASNLTVLEQLYRQHRRALVRLVERELYDVHEAEDVVQVTFLKAQQAIERGAVPRNPRAWLATIAINTARRVLRRRLPVRDAEERFDDARAPLHAELHEALGLLPENQRAALLYRDVLGLSYAETAAKMETTVGSVQMLLHRARNRLRSTLEGSFSGVGLARWLRSAATLAHAPATQAVAGATAALGLALAGGAAALDVAHAGRSPAPTMSAVSARVGRVPPRAVAPATHPTPKAASTTVSTRRPTPGAAAPSTTPGDTVPPAAPGDTDRSETQGAQPGPPSMSTAPAVPVPPLPVPALPAPTVTTPVVTAPAVTAPTVTVPGVATITAPTLTTPTVTIP
jgi:RNA polymerase sigma factor (sigma-70 family)